MSLPKVFAEGTLTVVIGSEPWPESMQVYAGPHKLNLVMAASVSAAADAPTAGEIALAPRTGRPETDLQIEQEARLLAALKWLKIRQR